MRGRCSSCACDGYDGGSEKKRCIGCGHPPGKHANVSTSLVGSTPLLSSSGVSSNTAAASNSSTSHSDWAIPTYSEYQCQYPDCQKESAFDPNTGAQNEYCHEHIQYTQMLQQASYEWSVGNTDSSDLASSESACSDSDSDQDLRWELANPLGSFFQLETQQALSNVIRSQHISPHKRTQSAGPVPAALARPMTAPPRQVQQPITMPQVTLVQAQQAIPVPQTIPGEIDHVYIADTQ